MAYPGGKAGSGAFQKIINQIPPHRVYIEPFLGAGAVMLHKRPALSSIGLDLDEEVIQAWKVVGPRPQNLIVEKRDAISFLRSYGFLGDEFVYCDPPYLYETRSGGRRRIYTHEFGDPEQHIELLTVLRSLLCSVAVSGYWSALYADYLRGWRALNFQVRTRGGTMATEWLWMNYPEPKELHDYSYLGDNFRERERISRIRKNMAAKLERMDQLERYAVLASIAEYRDGRR